MSQTLPASSLWSRQPIVDIPSEQWTRWLDPANHPSPYLLPEWALCWTQAWPSTTADVWLSGDLGICTVRRKRVGHTWVYGLPYGTPGGWLGTVPADAPEDELFRNLVACLTERDTVEVALSVAECAPAIKGWRQTTVTAQTWVIDRTGATASEIELHPSDSHRRNLEKGAAIDPAIKPVTDSQDAMRLFEAWPVPSEHPSRIVLNPTLSTALMTAFALSHNIRWCTAWMGEKPLATSLWLILHDRAVYVDGATVRRSQFTGAGHHLFCHMLSELYREGVRHFDLGSGPLGKSSAGLVQFKEGWGGRPETRTETIYRRPWYHWLHKVV